MAFWLIRYCWTSTGLTTHEGEREVSIEKWHRSVVEEVWRRNNVFWVLPFSHRRVITQHGVRTLLRLLSKALDNTVLPRDKIKFVLSVCYCILQTGSIFLKKKPDLTETLKRAWVHKDILSKRIWVMFTLTENKTYCTPITSNMHFSLQYKITLLNGIGSSFSFCVLRDSLTVAQAGLELAM